MAMLFNYKIEIYFSNAMSVIRLKNVLISVLILN